MMIRVEYAHANKVFAEKPDHAEWRLLGLFMETRQAPIPPGLEGERVWFRSRTEDPTCRPTASVWAYSESFVIPDPEARR